MLLKIVLFITVCHRADFITVFYTLAVGVSIAASCTDLPICIPNTATILKRLCQRVCCFFKYQWRIHVGGLLIGCSNNPPPLVFVKVHYIA